MILRIILILLSFDCVLVLFPQTNPIGGITLLLGDLLNFVVSNKKLSIMNKFVEITVDGEKCIINASAVQLVKPTDEGTLILFQNVVEILILLLCISVTNIFLKKLKIMITDRKF